MQFSAVSQPHYVVILISMFALTIGYPSFPTYLISSLSFTETNSLILFIPSLSFQLSATLCVCSLKMNVCLVLTSCCRCLSGPIDIIILNWKANLHAEKSSSSYTLTLWKSVRQ